MNGSMMKAETVKKLSLENYRIIELIGAGGMANIYKAIQLSLDRAVALKIMHQHLTANEGFIQRFEKEAKRAAQLQHENIVSIIDYGCENGVYYIAMEIIDGKNLRQILEKQKRLPLEICLLICHQVAEGLKYAHSHNLIHRDIKPANIILSHDGQVLIMDFGIAKSEDDLSITSTGQMIGSPAYMSPEQAAGKKIDHRSDIFSLGIILYEIISGYKPFNGDTYQEMVASIMSEEPESLQELRVDVNPEIEELVRKALIKDVDSRYQSVEDFADQIYSQLQRFKIPPVKKLISSFLKHPIKITEKLREEKISNHMESALYYVTMGEGRLNEARKEFQEVLRFDKDNESAREHLARLENHPALPQPRKRPKIKKFEIKKPYMAIGGVFAIVLFLALLMLSRGNMPNRDAALDQQVKSGLSSDSSAGSIMSGADEREVQAIEHAGGGRKKQVAKGNDSFYNYPNQGIGEFGLLTVKTNVLAEIYVDFEKYGKSNGPPIKLAPGRHFIEIKADGYDRKTRRIFTEKDKPIELQIDLNPGR